MLGYTIAAEIGDIARFLNARKLVDYTGLRPSVYQSGQCTDQERPRNEPFAPAGPVGCHIR